MQKWNSGPMHINFKKPLHAERNTWSENGSFKTFVVIGEGFAGASSFRSLVEEFSTRSTSSWWPLAAVPWGCIMLFIWVKDSFLASFWPMTKYSGLAGALASSAKSSQWILHQAALDVLRGAPQSQTFSPIIILPLSQTSVRPSPMSRFSTTPVLPSPYFSQAFSPVNIFYFWVLGIWFLGYPN